MPLTTAELERLLERVLDPVLSSRRTVSESATSLSQCTEKSQQFALQWLKIVCATNAELGYRFITNVAAAMSRMDLQLVEQWVVNALDIYDQSGLYPGTAALIEIDTFIKHSGTHRQAVKLKQERELLGRYLQGLSGRNMQIRSSSHPHTDTESVYLPEVINYFSDRKSNRLVLKAMATHLWGMNRFGTFKRATPDAPGLEQRLSELPDNANKMSIFHALEAERINACISRELPGLKRELNDLSGIPKHDATWQTAIDVLSLPTSTIDDTLKWTRLFLKRRIPLTNSKPWHGSIDIHAAEQASKQRLDKDKTELAKLIEELIQKLDAENSLISDETDKELQISLDNQSEDEQMELSINGEQVQMPPELRKKLEGMLQDLAQIPDEWLNANNNSEESPGNESEDLDLPAELPNSDPVFYYDEWDYQRKHYRKHWCTLYERQIAPGKSGFVDETIAKYHTVVGDLRRSFEILRDDPKTHKRQPFGDDIDLDAVVEANTDMRRGEEMTDRLFLKTQRSDRDIAVMFMVDLSGSTKGWIVDAEREALVLLCEALEVLGDRYAIYGFSGMTRKRCELFTIKQFSETYNESIKQRIAGIKPRDYTRMGVTIRHLTALMDTIDARSRLLITLSDGKPDDYDGYRGDYGIEDTRKALIEARNKGIHPFCITIDRQGSDYLPHMYGAVNYAVVDDVRKLPKEVSEVYCQLTR